MQDILICDLSTKFVDLEWHCCINALVHTWFNHGLKVVLLKEKTTLKLYLFIRSHNVVDEDVFLNMFILKSPIVLVGQWFLAPYL
jgi:hypothetical protein